MRITITTLLAMVSFAIQAQTTHFNDGWSFALGEEVNDSTNWSEVTIPHDWAFEGGYSIHGAQKDRGGYAMGGVGWYRKDFNIESLSKSHYTFIDFEGVYMNSEVWINGHYLGKRPYGYISFSYELTHYLVEGENSLKVKVDNSLEPSARWYHGCGIYGKVSLRVERDSYFEPDGVYVITPTITKQSGAVAIEAEVTTKLSKPKVVNIEYSVVDSSNNVVAKGGEKGVKLNGGTQTISFSDTVKSPKLWSPDSPNLYTLHLSLTDSGKEKISTISTRFGFRSFEWTAQTGFHLNGKQLKLRGVCEHFEGGPTGAISTDELMRWRLQKIKDMGCNAVRCAHNPFLPHFYDICDEMGLLVMDEIFDGWMKKADHDYGAQAFDEWWERDLSAWLKRDRNHPSIFAYSLGNETHGDIAPSLVALCHKLDPTRAVTSGSANPDDMDIYGMNGGSEKLSFIESWDQHKPFVATENPHTWQVRGYYRSQTWYRDGYPNVSKEPQKMENLTDKEIFGYDWTEPSQRRSRKQVFNSSYDNAYVRVTARHILEVLRDKEWFSGSFRWTGFDYLGEAGYVHGGWPFRAFQSGALDLAGFEKDLYYLYQSEWSDRDMVHILPHWTHPQMEQGVKIPVWVYTTGDEVELFLNGKSLGRKQKGKKWSEIQCEWLVPWCEGVIEAIAYRDGVEIARMEQRSAGAPSKLHLRRDDKGELLSDGEDVAIITIEQQDSKGTLYPYGENRIYTYIYGAARMLSFESGSPVDTETNFAAKSKCAFFGLNRMFIQSTSSSDNSPKGVIVASICGDKKLMLSDEISISCEELVLSGKAPKRDLSIRYTTDGSQPTQSSKLYRQPFKIELGSTVKAIIYDGDKAIIELNERFTKDDGLYWGTPGEESTMIDGNQAENGTLSGGAYRAKRGGEGYFAAGYVLFKGKGSSVGFYQENDGESYESKISIRYSQQTPDNRTTQMELWNNDKLVKVIDFSNTGSEASHWKEYAHKLTIEVGANNIVLKAVSEYAPAIDQITIMP